MPGTFRPAPSRSNPSRPSFAPSATFPCCPPNAAIASTDNIRAAFAAAGLTDLRQRTISVTRVFADFEAFWTAMLGTGAMGAALDKFEPDQRASFKQRVQARLSTDADGSVSYSASANAISGSVPA